LLVGGEPLNLFFCECTHNQMCVSDA
jgi:hypothetical protein